jgi:hypothetical protein
MLVWYHVEGGVPHWSRREVGLGFLAMVGGIDCVVGPGMLSIVGVGLVGVDGLRLSAGNPGGVAGLGILAVDSEILAAVRLLVELGALLV